MSRRSAIIYMGSLGVGIAACAAVRGARSSEDSHEVVNKSEPAIQRAEQRKSGMFKDKEVASDISKLMFALGAQLNGSLIRVQEQCPASEFEAYRAVVGRLMGEMFVEVSMPIFAQYPDLKPPELR
jgi:hypothetical protein